MVETHRFLHNYLRPVSTKSRPKTSYCRHSFVSSARSTTRPHHPVFRSARHRQCSIACCGPTRSTLPRFPCFARSRSTPRRIFTHRNLQSGIFASRTAVDRERIPKRPTYRSYTVYTEPLGRFPGLSGSTVLTRRPCCIALSTATMNVNKKFDRLKHFVGEKFGSEVRTNTTDDFKALEMEMQLRHEGTPTPGLATVQAQG